MIGYNTFIGLKILFVQEFEGGTNIAANGDQYLLIR